MVPEVPRCYCSSQTPWAQLWVWGDVGGFTTRSLLPYGFRLKVYFNALALELMCWPQSLFYTENLHLMHHFLPLELDTLFFQGVLTRDELGSLWDTHKGDPKSGTSMIYWWADHPQLALACPGFSSASWCPQASESLLLPQGEQGILA